MEVLAGDEAAIAANLPIGNLEGCLDTGFDFKLLEDMLKEEQSNSTADTPCGGGEALGRSNQACFFADMDASGIIQGIEEDTFHIPPPTSFADTAEVLSVPMDTTGHHGLTGAPHKSSSPHHRVTQTAASSSACVTSCPSSAGLAINSGAQSSYMLHHQPQLQQRHSGVAGNTAAGPGGQMTKNQPYTAHTHFPDSPPDSGSEPYSPPNDSSTDYNGKATDVTNMSSLPHHMYINQSTHQRVNPAHQSVSPPQAHQQNPPPHPTLPHHHAPAPKPIYNHNGYPCVEPPKLNHLPPTGVGVSGGSMPGMGVGPGMPPATMNSPALSQLNPQLLQSQFSSMNNAANQPPKKRKFSESPQNTVTPGIMSRSDMSAVMNIKTESLLPPECAEDESYGYDIASDASMFLDSTYQVIKWQPFTPNKWCTLHDHSGKELSTPTYRVDADKGFNYSPPDDAFVCQKKNHFQVTVHLGLHGNPKYVKTPEGKLKPIQSYHLKFNGVKMESTSQTIRIEQSQSDRSKKPFHPVKVDPPHEQVTKVTIGRLHFSETTTNNMRKKGKPNPDQRYFLLVVSLVADVGGDESHMVAAQMSEKIIVRASNPGQFDSDVDVLWNKGRTPDSVFHMGLVGVNTDSPDEAMTVMGNLKVTGHIVQPSDARVKEDIKEVDSREQLKNVAKLRMYNYKFNNDFAQYAGLSDDELEDTGVLAHEVSEILPDAVKEAGDIILPNGEVVDNFKVVNKERIFYESVGAVRELCKVTDKLEYRINEIETNAKTRRPQRDASIRSTCSAKSVSNCSTISRSNSLKPTSCTGNSSSKKICKSSHHRHRHRCEGSSVYEGESGPCSNRLIQIIVIILVIVMAFCSLAMIVLYVLDKKSGSHTPHVHLMHVNSPPLQAHTTTGHSQINTSHTTTAPLQGRDVDPNAPTGPNKDHPFVIHHDDHLVPVKTDVRGSKHLSGSSNSTLYPESTSYVPDGPRPIFPIQCKDKQCPKRCCNMSSIPSTPGPRQNDPQDKTPKPDPQENETGQKINVHTNSSNVPYDVPGVEIGDYNDHPNSSRRRPYGQQPVIDIHQQAMEFSQMDDVPTVQEDRHRRDVDTDEPDLVIVQLNSSLGSEYCNNQNCLDGQGGNYSYSVPISSVFPKFFLTIRFRLSDSNPPLKLHLCQSHLLHTCSDVTIEEKPMPSADHSWDLPVGLYYNTDYKFRVANVAEKETVCGMGEEELGKTFDEYNLFFYRVCDDM